MRPATPLTCAFIAEHREEFGVAPICRALSQLGVPIAPRTYYAHIARVPWKRQLWDWSITEVLAGYYEPDQHGHRAPESLYGSVKMWAHGPKPTTTLRPTRPTRPDTQTEGCIKPGTLHSHVDVEPSCPQRGPQDSQTTWIN